jgi:phage gp46-like protein
MSGDLKQGWFFLHFVLILNTNKLLTAIHISLSYDLNANFKEHLLDKKGVWWKSTKVSSRLDVFDKRKDLNIFFTEAVDDTLKQIFKEDGAKVIYEFLENHSRLKLEEVADKPEVFSATLERLMVSAAHVIEKMILKNLYCRLGLKFEEKKGYEFPDYIRELREE